MGEVWRARHRMLKRPAAIKTIRTSEPPPEKRSQLLHRFDREAQATAALQCPHTVELYDYGPADDGTFFYVMELLEGLDLRHMVERFGALPPGRVIHLLQQACLSLDEAHSLNLIHRDIKTSNIYLCRLGDEVDFVKVLDFGLVKFYDEEDGPVNQATNLTATNMVLGTPGFMAPEQIVGHGTEPRTDIYALGCVGYWLLTALPVFDGLSTMDLISRHARDVPLTPSVRIGRALSPQLEEIIMQCLKKDPLHRPTARALRQALIGVTDCDPWTEAQARKWWDENLPHIVDAASPDAGPAAARSNKA